MRRSVLLGVLATALVSAVAPAHAAPRAWLAICDPPGARGGNLDADLFVVDAAGRSEALTTGASVANFAAGGGTIAYAVPRFDGGFLSNTLRIRRAGTDAALSLTRFFSPRAVRGDGRLLAYSARRADDRGNDLLTVRLDRRGARPVRVARETGPGIWQADFDGAGALWATEPRSTGRPTIVRKLTGRRATFTDRTRPYAVDVGNRLIALGSADRVVIRTRSGRFVAQLKGAGLERWSSNDRTVIVRLDKGAALAEWTPSTGSLRRWAPSPCGTAFRLQPAS